MKSQTKSIFTTFLPTKFLLLIMALIFGCGTDDLNSRTDKPSESKDGGANLVEIVKSSYSSSQSFDAYDYITDAVFDDEAEEKAAQSCSESVNKKADVWIVNFRKRCFAMKSNGPNVRSATPSCKKDIVKYNGGVKSLINVGYGNFAAYWHCTLKVDCKCEIEQYVEVSEPLQNTDIETSITTDISADTSSAATTETSVPNTSYDSSDTTSGSQSYTSPLL